MSMRPGILNGLLWSAVEKWGGKSFAFLTFLLLARLLEPEVFGLVALATVFTSFVQVFVGQGFAEAIVQREDLERDHLDTAFWTNLAMGLGMAAIGFLGAGPIADLLGDSRLEPILRVLSLVFVFSSLGGVPMALCRRDLAFKALAARTLTANVVGGIVGVGMALTGFGVWSLVIQTLVTSLMEAFVLWWATGWIPRFRVSRRHFADLFSFGINVAGAQLLHFIIRHSDNLLIGYFLGATALGYYTVAYRILGALTDLITNVMSRVAFPVFSKMQKEPERLLSAFCSATRYASLIAFPVFVGLGVAAPEVVPIVFGEVWIPSIPVMQILAAAGLIRSIGSFNGDMLMAIGRPSLVLALSSIAAITSVIAFSIAVQWGIVAVAAAGVIRMYLLFPLGPWLLSRFTGLDLKTYLGQFVVPLASSAAIILTVTLLRLIVGGIAPIEVMLGLEIIVGLIAYTGMIFLIAPSTVQTIMATVRSTHVGRGITR